MVPFHKPYAPKLACNSCNKGKWLNFYCSAVYTRHQVLPRSITEHTVMLHYKTSARTIAEEKSSASIKWPKGNQ